MFEAVMTSEFRRVVPTHIMVAVMLALAAVTAAPLGNQTEPASALAVGTPHAAVFPAMTKTAITTANTARFESNAGQSDPSVRFLARGSNPMFLTAAGAAMVVTSPHGGGGAVVRMEPVGANPTPAVIGLDKLPGTSNYLVGNDPSKWHTGISSYARVAYRDVYPGVDLIFHGGTNGVEYDFVVAPGASSEVIAVNFKGADGTRIDGAGSLILATGGGEVRQHQPVLYQDAGGRRRSVTGGFVVKGDGRIGFSVGAHDPTKPLVIDPVLSYSTYLGTGVGTADPDHKGLAEAVAVDGSGSAYVTGATDEVAYPTTTGAFQTHPNGAPDSFDPSVRVSNAFITKLSPDGSSLAYSTYLGGSNSDQGRSIALDTQGNAYVVGVAGSTDFPLHNALQTTKGAGSSSAFVTELTADGSNLVFSTYLGGTNSDQAIAVAVDASGNIYVSGHAQSTDFPTHNALSGLSTCPTAGGFCSTGFVTKYTPGGAAMAFSTYLGGNTRDSADGLAVDLSGVYVTGFTKSTNFPTSHPLQAALSGGADAFVTKLAVDGSALVYSTYLGGSGNVNLIQGQDNSDGRIAVDTSGNAYVTGVTDSADFPTMNAFQASAPGSINAFVTRLNWSGSSLTLGYSTYLGGSFQTNFGQFSQATGGAIAVDSSGRAYVTGVTSASVTASNAPPASFDFPTVDPVAAPNGNNPCQFCDDAFVSELNSQGSGLIYSTYLGGTGSEAGFGIAVGPGESTYVVGSTTSFDFPTTPGAFEPGPPAGYVGFVSKIGPVSATAPAVAAVGPSTGPTGGGDSVVVHGSGFAGATGVHFGAVPAAFSTSSDTVIVATAPAQAPGTGALHVTVTGSGGTSAANPVDLYAYGEGGWAPSGATTDIRDGAGGGRSENPGPTATLIAGPNCGANCGKVLVAGGSPQFAQFGGSPLSSAELYNPGDGSWTATSPMVSPHSAHTATLLSGPNCGSNCGKVLVVGGSNQDSGGSPSTAAELFDPAAGTWTATGALDSCTPVSASCTGRAHHTATLLSSGKVLVAGSSQASTGSAIATAESYDPSTGQWSPAPSMDSCAGVSCVARFSHTATLLPDGRALVAGGCCGATGGDAYHFPKLASAEIYDPAANGGAGAWTATGSMATSRSVHTATALAGGTVYVAGGFDSAGVGLSSAEVYSPATGVWTATTGLLQGRGGHTATMLPNGRVLLAGGRSGLSGNGSFFSTAEIYDPASSQTRSAGMMNRTRVFSVAALLSSTPCGTNCGKVIVTGGSDDNTSQLYAPTAPVAAALPAMSNAAYGGYVTAATIQNTGPAPAAVSIAYFDQHGAPVGAGDAVIGLPPNASWTVRQDNGDSFSAGQAGSAIVYSTQPVASFVNEFPPGNVGDATSYTGVEVPSGVGATLYAPTIVNSAYGGYTTGIGLLNQGGSPTDVTVTYRNGAGAVVKTQTVGGLAAHAYQALYSGDAGLGLPTGFAGTATITGSGGQPLGAVVNETGPGGQLSSYDAVPSGALSLDAPVALNNAFGGYNTGMGVQNTSATAGTVSITYYDSAGAAAPAKTFPISANGYLGVYQGSASDGPAPGAYTATIQSATVPLAAVVNEVAPSNGGAAQQSTSYNTFATGSSILHLPLVENARSDPWNTGEGIMNTGAAGTTVTVTYYDAISGAAIGTAQTQTLAPNAFWGLYQPTGGLPSGSRATAVVTTTAGGQVAVICNESSPTTFMSYDGQ